MMEEWSLELSVAGISTLLITAAALAIAVLLLLSPKPRPSTPSECKYLDPLTKAPLPFPSLVKASAGSAPDSRVRLSVVVPAYCEQDRLPAMISEAVNVLDSRLTDPAFSYEMIIVDDGSKDQTTTVALELAEAHMKKQAGHPKINIRREIRVMTLELNRGKGGAVTQGVLASRGDLILFVDADGASRFEDIKKLEEALLAIETDSLGVALGSRAHMVDSESVVKRSFMRNFLMQGFHMAVFLLGVQSIKDTQCGFKLFTRDSAKLIFPCMHTEGWIFDIEVLLLAEFQHIPIAEVPISWHEVEGSKMSLLRDAVEMLVQLIMIRLNFMFGFWHVSKKSPK
ncbi:hypothetical protein BSLG_000905 [Batrachochytrium salamandrivorans]|nr:hypothetical protein BASA83_004199 [Batrachochytrium salamandrivorans]KAJ1345392.1 hypothetical protein BSLG_000905 [Batrachochytrium salamandrivorans]